MAFRNPITSLTQLSGQITTTQIAPGSITTPLLAAGAITGQTITGGVINGAVFNGSDFIQNSNGTFFYAATPAAGNLIGSIAPVAGTDAFGNVYNALLNIGDQTHAHFGVDHSGIVYVVNTADQNIIQIDPQKSALYLYGGTPVSGNLLVSLATAAGTDRVGNAYQQGLTLGSATGGEIVVTPAGAATGESEIDLYPPSSAGTWTPGYLLGGFAAGSVYTVLDSPKQSTATHTARIQLFGGMVGADLSQIVAEADSITLGSLTSPLVSVANAVTKAGAVWQNVAHGTLTLGTGWADNAAAGGVQTIQYRLDGQDRLLIDGTIHSTSATPAGTLFTLAAGFLPKLAQRVAVVTRVGGVNTVNQLGISSATGAVTLGTAITATGVDVNFSVNVPMGNIT